MLGMFPDSVMFPICVLGIYGCYFVYGYLQEELIVIEKINPLLPILSQSVIAVIIAFIFNLIMSIQHGKKFEVSSPIEFYIGFMTCLTMSSSNYALSYVDYPTQALVKS
jgi:hypothetical protein